MVSLFRSLVFLTAETQGDFPPRLCASTVIFYYLSSYFPITYLPRRTLHVFVFSLRTLLLIENQTLPTDSPDSSDFIRKLYPSKNLNPFLPLSKPRIRIYMSDIADRDEFAAPG